MTSFSTFYEVINKGLKAGNPWGMSPLSWFFVKGGYFVITSLAQSTPQKRKPAGACTFKITLKITYRTAIKQTDVTTLLRM